MGAVNILGVLCFAGLLSARYRRRLEETLPLTACLGILLLFVLGMLRRLSWVDGISLALLAATAVGLAVCFLRRRSFGATFFTFLKQYFLTPGLVCVVMTAVLFWVLTSTRYVFLGDDLNYWAVETKSLWYSNGLVDGLRHCALSFSSYTPGMQLVQWWYLHVLGVWRENALYFGLFFTGSLMFLPLLRRVTFRQWYLWLLYLVAAVLGPTVFSDAAYYALSTDAALGFFFGYCLFYLWEASHGSARLPMLAAGAGLAAMVLVKQVAMVWVAASLLFFFLVCQNQKRRKEKLTLRWICVLLAPLVTFIAWFIFCRVMGLGNYLVNKGSDVVRALLQGVYERPAGLGNVLRYIARAFFASPHNMSGYWDGTKSLVGLPMAGWMVTFALIPLFCRRSVQGEERLSWRGAAVRMAGFSTLTGLFYLLVFALSFFTIFSHEVYHYAKDMEDVVQLMDRYFMPYYFGMAYLGIGILANEMQRLREAGARVASRRILATLVTVMFVFGNYQAMWYMWPSHYAQMQTRRSRGPSQWPYPAWALGIAEEARAQTRILPATSNVTFFLAYAMVPVSFVGLPTQVREAGDGPEALKEYIVERGITHVVALDEENENYGFLCRSFGIALDLEQLYRIDLETTPMTLTPVSE